MNIAVEEHFCTCYPAVWVCLFPLVCVGNGSDVSFDVGCVLWACCHLLLAGEGSNSRGTGALTGVCVLVLGLLRTERAAPLQNRTSRDGHIRTDQSHCLFL